MREVESIDRSHCPWEHPDTGSYQDMNYLLCEGARSRYVIAAHFVRDCPVIVEIGGFKTPITAFLERIPERVLVVDPIIEPYQGAELHGKPCRIDHVRATYQAFEFDLTSGSYGLVCMGLSLKHFSAESKSRAEEWRKLVELLDHSRTAVIECALEWPLGRECLEGLVAKSNSDVVMHADIDLRHSPGMATEHHLRRLVVLRPRRR